MQRFRAIVFAAALAGLGGGLFMTLAQQVGTVPLILQAEVYEGTAPAPPVGSGHEHGGAAQARPEADAWTPQDGLERTLFTLAANVVTAVGFALLLVAGFALRGGTVGWREGLFWGLAGFAVFSLAPFLGLPPELPAVPAAPLGPRQAWWLLAVVATAAGLGLIAFRRSPVAAVAAVALLVAPHLIGAPQPDAAESPIPEDLLHRFVVAVTLTSFLFWLLLGVLGAWCWRRLDGGAGIA